MVAGVTGQAGNESDEKRGGGVKRGRRCRKMWDPKKHSKMAPKWIPKVVPEASRGPRIMINSDARSGLKFRHIFRRFQSPKWAPKWAPKSLKNPTWAPPAAPGTPKAARRSPGSNFWASRGPFWCHFGAMLEPLGGHFRTMFRHRPPHFSVALVTCLPCHSCYHGVPDTQGRRVPALALTIS